MAVAVAAVGKDVTLKERPHIWAYPGRCSGAPALAGHRLPTATVARYYAQLGQDETERAYVIERDDILVCCWFEARHGGRMTRRKWKAWLKEHEGALWEGEWDDVPLPPMDPPPGASNPR